MDEHVDMRRDNRRTAVFIIPAEGYRVDDFIDAARRLGVRIVVATDAHHGLAEDMGAELIPIDFDRPADGARRIAAYPYELHAVIPIDDRGVEMAAGAAEFRDLAHNSPETAAVARDKAESRRRLDGIVAQPKFELAEVESDVEEVVAGFDGPVVVKPLGLAGSMGVIRVDVPDRAPGVAARVRNIAAKHGFAPDGPVLIESFVEGPEVAVEGLVTDGSWDTLAIFDKPDRLDGPYFAETHYVTPSRHPTISLSEIEQTAALAARALGIRQGPVHAELRLTSDGVVLIELAARSIGGLCGRALRFGLSDTSLEEILIRNALGERVRGTRLAPGASGVTMIPVPRPGVFGGLSGVAEALATEHVTDVEVGRMIGREVMPLPEESTYLGFVFARADTPDAVERALRTATARLEVRIEQVR